MENNSVVMKFFVGDDDDDDDDDDRVNVNTVIAEMRKSLKSGNFDVNVKCYDCNCD